MSSSDLNKRFIIVLFGRAWAGVGSGYVSSSNQSNGSFYSVSCICSRVSKYIYRVPPKSKLDFVVPRLRVQKKSSFPFKARAWKISWLIPHCAQARKVATNFWSVYEVASFFPRACIVKRLNKQLACIVWSLYDYAAGRILISVY